MVPQISRHRGIPRVIEIYTWEWGRGKMIDPVVLKVIITIHLPPLKQSSYFNSKIEYRYIIHNNSCSSKVFVLFCFYYVKRCVLRALSIFLALNVFHFFRLPASFFLFRSCTNGIFLYCCRLTLCMYTKTTLGTPLASCRGGGVTGE